MSKTSAQARRHLDAELELLRLVAEAPGPSRGWIRAVRRALGMTGAELAARMGVGQSTISGLEKGEVEGTITVSSLRRIARGLECELVYYLAPKDTLEASVRNRARQQLEREGSIPAGAGAGAGAGERAGERAGAGAEIEELVAKRIDQPGLWSDPPAR